MPCMIYVWIYTAVFKVYIIEQYIISWLDPYRRHTYIFERLRIEVRTGHLLHLMSRGARVLPAWASLSGWLRFEAQGVRALISIGVTPVCLYVCIVILLDVHGWHILRWRRNRSNMRLRSHGCGRERLGRLADWVLSIVSLCELCWSRTCIVGLDQRGRIGIYCIESLYAARLRLSRIVIEVRRHYIWNYFSKQTYCD